MICPPLVEWHSAIFRGFVPGCPPCAGFHGCVATCRKRRARGLPGALSAFRRESLALPFRNRIFPVAAGNIAFLCRFRYYQPVMTIHDKQVGPLSTKYGALLWLFRRLNCGRRILDPQRF
jgi:hypothetical protein